MSGDFPEDWFRPEPASRGTGQDASTAPSAGDERYTDQFKPHYQEHEPRRHGATAGSPAEATGGAGRPGGAAGAAGPAVAPPPEPAARSTSGASHSVGVAPSSTTDAIDDPGGRRLRRVVPVVGGLLALAAVGVAIGQLVNRTADTTNTTDPQLSDPPAASSGAPSKQASAAPTPWTGAVKLVRPTGVTASCTAPAQQGYDGGMVSSSASRVLDGNLATGWRCDGDGQGETLRFTFPKGTKVVGIRMTNGYTKSVAGTSLYPQYRRVTTVTWSFPKLDNAFFLQNLADNRPSLQEIRIPETAADGGMEMQVTTSSSPGSADATRNAVVLTEVEFLVRAS